MAPEVIFTVTVLPIVGIVGILTYIIVKRNDNRNVHSHQSSCSNCGADLILGSHRVILYDNPEYFNYGLDQQELWVCPDCYNNPEKLDEEKIFQTLRERSWEEREINLVMLAVKKYKETTEPISILKE